VAVVDGHLLVTEAIGRTLLTRFRALPVPLQSLRTTVEARNAVLRTRADVAVVILPAGGAVDALTLVAELASRGIGVVVTGAPPAGESLDDYAAVGASPLRSTRPQIADLVKAIDAELHRLSHDGGADPVLAPAPQFVARGTDGRWADRQTRLLLESLTTAESRILWALMHGRGPEDIAQERVVSVATVRTHIAQILRKLQVRSQLSAVALAWDAGWMIPAVDLVA
jgi:DNA-binding NarL/FixJ family response regulator